MARRTFVTVPKDRRDGRPVPLGAQVRKLLFSGAVAGTDPNTGTIPDDPQRQADLAFDNLGTLVAEAGLTLDNVGHVSVWYASHAHRQYLHAPWARHFPDPDDRPARHSMVKDVGGSAVIQLEVIAVEGASRRSVSAIPGVSHGNPASPSAAIPFGVRLGEYVFSAATIGRNGITGDTPATIEGRAEQAYENNRIFLELVGLSDQNVAHVVAWYTDHRLHDALDPGWSRHFPDARSQPAWNAVVRELPGVGDGVQIEIIAVAGAERTSVEIPLPSGQGDRAGRRPGGCRIGDTFFSSAVSGVDSSAAAGPGSVEQQTELAFERTQTLLDHAGFGLAEVGRVRVWLSERRHAEAVDRVWQRIFPSEDDRPARHDIVSDLSGDAVVELELIAAR